MAWAVLAKNEPYRPPMLVGTAKHARHEGVFERPCKAPCFISRQRKRGRSLQELSYLGKQRLACSEEGVDQRLLREFLDDRFDNPSQPQGHVTRQRDGPTLNID